MAFNDDLAGMGWLGSPITADMAGELCAELPDPITAGSGGGLAAANGIETDWEVVAASPLCVRSTFLERDEEEYVLSMVRECVMPGDEPRPCRSPVVAVGGVEDAADVVDDDRKLRDRMASAAVSFKEAPAVVLRRCADVDSDIDRFL